MATSVAPTVEAPGTTGTPANADPIDALDLSSIDDSVITTEATELPEGMMLGEQPKAAKPAEEVAAAGTQRNADGTFAKKGEQPPADAAATVETPFQYRAMAATHTLDGAKLDKDGNLTVPAAKVADIRRAFNALHVAQAETFPALERAQGEATQLRQQVDELTKGRTVADQRAEALTNALSQAMAEPDDTKFVEAVFRLRQAWPQLTAKAEAEYWKSQVERGKAAPPVAAAPAPRASEAAMPEAQAALKTTLEFVEDAKVENPQYRDLTAADWKQYDEQLRATPYAFLRPATAEEVTKYGVQLGQVVFDTDAAARHLTAFATATRTARETATGQRALATDNARRTAPSVSTPPNPSGSKAPSPAAKPAGFQTKKDVDDWFDSPEL
jgi:hypothetical protein